jgi:ABC-type glutathione transport system ATPase component
MAGSDNGPLLVVQGLRVEAGSRVPLISDVSFELGRGERVAVLGHSGSGKSVMAHAIAGVLRPPLRVASGKVAFGALNSAERSAFVMFQNPGAALNPCLPIRTQLRRIATRARRTSPDESVETVLERSGLKATGDLYPFQISGGMKQRVIFAAAWLQRPALLIADEVTTGLDPLSRREFRASLDALLEYTGSALLFLSHDLGLAAEICPKALVMERGQLVAQGSWSTLGSQHPAAKALVTAALSMSTPLC